MKLIEITQVDIVDANLRNNRMGLIHNGTLMTLQGVQLSMTNVNVSTNTIESTIISSPITLAKSASTSSDIVTTAGDSVTISDSEFDAVSGQFLQCGVLKGTMYDYYGIDSS